MHIQNFIEIHPFILKILGEKTHFFTKIKGHNSIVLFQNKISPFAIPYHSSPISVPVQSLKKIGQKILKLEHEMKRWRMDGHSNTQPLFVWPGIKMTCAQQRHRLAWASTVWTESSLCTQGNQGPKVSSYQQQRLWSDWADDQADLSLRWLHWSFCWFCLAPAQ